MKKKEQATNCDFCGLPFGHGYNNTRITDHSQPEGEGREHCLRCGVERGW